MEKHLFVRWLASCVIDYGLLAAATLFFALGWPGGSEPLRTVVLIALVQLLYQPLGELLGGTVGQRLTGIRLIAPSTISTVSIATIIRRHGERMGVLWGLLAAYLYWRKRLGPQETRTAATSPGGWEWTARNP